MDVDIDNDNIVDSDQERSTTTNDVKGEDNNPEDLVNFKDFHFIETYSSSRNQLHFQESCEIFLENVKFFKEILWTS